MSGPTKIRNFLETLGSDSTSPFRGSYVHVRLDLFLKERFKIRTLEQRTAVWCCLFKLACISMQRFHPQRQALLQFDFYFHHFFLFLMRPHVWS